MTVPTVVAAPTVPTVVDTLVLDLEPLVPDLEPIHLFDCRLG